jgi:tetratricopeptide (TPR) repeat protein
MGDLYSKQGLLGDAVAKYNEFADRMKAKGEMERVFRTYKKIKEIMPKKLDVRLSLVDMYLARNRSDDAVSELREVAQLFREQDKTEDAEGVEARIRALGGSIKPEKVVEAGPITEEGEHTRTTFSGVQELPPGLREPGAEPPPQPMPTEVEAPVMEEPIPATAPEEAVPGSEITFEQTTSDLEIERTQAPASMGPELVTSEPEASEPVAPGVGGTGPFAPEAEPPSAPTVETKEPEAESLELDKAETDIADLIEKEEEAASKGMDDKYEPMFKSSPTDHASYVELADLCLSVGNADEAAEHFYSAADAYFKEKSYDKASEIYERIAEIRPLELRPRQRVAQSAQKKGDTEGLIKAYIGLGNCLERRGAAKEAASVYKRVLKLDPQNDVALSKLPAAVEQVAEPAAKEPTKAKPKAKPKAKAKAKPEPAPAAGRTKGRLHVEAEPAQADDNVSFDDIIKEVSSEPRFRVEEEPKKKGGLLTMAELLQEFKTGVEENIPIEDYSSHYDLGITYKEMGLLDEAVEEFTKASKSPEKAATAFEMLGRIFLEKKDYKGAVAHLKAGLSSKVSVPEEQMGLFYNIGRAYEGLGAKNNAFTAYSKVKSFDPNFEDIEARLASVQPEEAEPAPALEVEAAAEKVSAPPKPKKKPERKAGKKKKGKISYV